MTQAKLPLPVRVEIVRLCDVPGCYDVFCDFADGTSEVLNPTVAYGDPDDRRCITWYVAGLRAAVLAAHARWGSRVRIELSRCPRRSHRKRLVLAA